jgi:AraC-like DNA-binding protein
LSLKIIERLDFIHRHGEADRIEKLCETILLEASILKRHAHTPSRQEDKKIEEIASYLNANYKKKINIGEIISRHGFSKRSFYREWNRKYSVTPYEYLESLRMSMASSLLCASDIRIGEIASTLNYEDSLYFSKRFRGAFNMSPREYRKKFGNLS